MFTEFLLNLQLAATVSFTSALYCIKVGLHEKVKQPQQLLHGPPISGFLYILHRFKCKHFSRWHFQVFPGSYPQGK